MKHVQIDGFRRAFIRLLLFTLMISVIPGVGFITQAQSGGTLSYGSRVYGTIHADAPLAAYALTGQQGDFVSLSADSWTGTLDAALEIVAPNGVSLTRSTQNTPQGDPLGAQLTVFLPASGIYIVRVSGDNGSVGDFLLTVVGRSAAVSTPLVFGQPLDVSISLAAPPQFFSFDAVACPTTLIVRDPSAGQPFAFPFIVKLRDQRGSTVALLRGGEQLEDWVTVEALSGRYEVEVSGDPALSGSITLLVTCAGDNPGCPSEPADGVVCAPCPPVEPLLPGACPDVNLTASPHPDAPNWVTVTWDAIPGADDYAVYVTGLVESGGEVYLTHGDWAEGNPLSFTWVLPAEGYTGFNFTLRIIVDDVVICIQDTAIEWVTIAPDCPDLGLTAVTTDPDVRATTVGWAPGLDADQFDLDLYTMVGGSESHSGRLELSGDTAEYHFEHFPPEIEQVRFVLSMWQAGRVCSEELVVVFTDQPEQFAGEACAVRADHGGVTARVGPGILRSAFAFLDPTVEYLVLGQAAAEDGSLWWEIDKTQFAGHEAVISLWVAQADVIAIGDCNQVPQADIPDIVPIPEEPPPGSWLPCGSCDTCGHPANECVTSPEGVCLWDPATCQITEPPPPDDLSPQCYAVSAAIDMGVCYGPGSAMLDTPPNCEGTLYTPGTLIAAHALAVDEKCVVHSWTGCGVSATGSSITFVPPGSCTVTAHMGY